MKRTFILFAVFVACAAVHGQPATRVILPSLTSEVTVQRDGRGIPYIDAKNDHDLYFAQGYVTASDRLFQMDLMRRLARGETSEIFGSAALDQDKRWRRFGFAEVANQALGTASPEMREALNAYANGVNAYIATLTDANLPPEFRILQYRPRQWAATDSIVLGKILADALSTTWQNDLLRASMLQSLSKEKFADASNEVTPYDVVLFGKDTGRTGSALAENISVSEELLSFAKKDAAVRAAGLSLVGLYAEDLAASNNFVVSGKRTADGKPILENDPHLQATAPGIWHMVELSSPGVHAAGVTFPGTPGVVLGHNENIAWGATNVGPDVQDLYSETFNEKGEVKTPTGWQRAQVRHETIKVRANPLNPTTTDTVVDYTITPHGPIIIEEGDKKYALRWTALDPKNQEFEAFFRLNRARNWDEFQQGLKTYGGATQNFVFADVKGNIGWYAAGKIPIRRSGDGRVPYDGASSDGDWIGYIPFEDLPHLYNPPDGVIVTANQRIVGTDYKYTSIGRDVAPPWRARMIFDDIGKKPKLTMDDVRDIQYETYNIPLANLANEIVKRNAASTETLVVLRAWDGRMNAESTGATIVNEIRSCMQERIATGNNGSVPTSVKGLFQIIVRDRILDTAVKNEDKKWLPSGIGSYAELMTSCDTTSRLSLEKRLGGDPNAWTWGRSFQSRFPHPLASAPLIGLQFATPTVPIGGSGQTPNVGSSVSMRFIASPGNWDATRHVIPLGESGDPKSPHFKDQFEAWRTGTTMIFPFSKEAIAAAAKEVWILSPR
ncbi:MAG: penicillin acylase family protein [Acidobacteria bacterium]|nr:penicillin acylase family protein [Acidobacteriota bacterium]